MKDYYGYLQAGASSGYDGIDLESDGRTIEVGYWALAVDYPGARVGSITSGAQPP